MAKLKKTHSVKAGVSPGNCGVSELLCCVFIYILFIVSTETTKQKKETRSSTTLLPASTMERAWWRLRLSLTSALCPSNDQSTDMEDPGVFLRSPVLGAFVFLVVSFCRRTQELRFFHLSHDLFPSCCFVFFYRKEYSLAASLWAQKKRVGKKVRASTN